MWRFKFSAWAVVLMMTALSFGACDNDDDDTFVPPSNITEALKQVYPAAQNVEWEMKGAYYVADCWVSNDELEVWFDANANWVMTENELNSIDQLVPAVYTAFMDSKYNAWVVTDVYVLTFPQNPMESVIQVKQGSQRYALYFLQEGGLLHEKDISNGDDTHWPPTEEFLIIKIKTGYSFYRNSPLFFIITFVYNPWLILLHLFLCKVMEGRVRFVSLLVLLCRKRHGAYHR